jgi:hypothetical protein
MIDKMCSTLIALNVQLNTKYFPKQALSHGLPTAATFSRNNINAGLLLGTRFNGKSNWPDYFNVP